MVLRPTATCQNLAFGFEESKHTHVVHSQEKQKFEIFTLILPLPEAGSATLDSRVLLLGCKRPTNFQLSAQLIPEPSKPR